MRTVVLAAPAWFAARYFLRTGILPALLEKPELRVVVLARPEDTARLAAELQHERLHVRPLAFEGIRKAHAASAIAPRLSQIARFVMDARHPHDTAIYLEHQFFRRYRRLGRLHALSQAYLRGAIRLARRSRAVRDWLRRLADRTAPRGFHDGLYEEIRPDLLVVPSLGYFDVDAYLIREARRHGVRTAGVVVNWDNTTNKGMSLANPDLAIVWGAKMRDEVIAHHDLPAERIREGGVPHYDLYFRPETFSPRQEFCRANGLDPDRPIVLYAAMSPRRFPYNPAVVEILARAARVLSPERPAQILVRLHPIYLGWRTENPTGWAAEEARFKAIAEENGNVALMLPKGRTGENGSFDLDEEDNRVLANCLRHSSLVVCFFSTLNLEAAIFDKPIINCALFDLQRWLGPDNRTVLYPTHLTNLLRSRACRMAYTEDELRRHLGEYLADPELDSAARASLWQAECGPLAGRSARRVADLLAEAAGC